MSSGTFVDRIDPFAKRSLKKKPKKSQGSSRYRTGGDVELTALPLLKGKKKFLKFFFFGLTKNFHRKAKKQFKTTLHTRSTHILSIFEIMLRVNGKLLM